MSRVEAGDNLIIYGGLLVEGSLVGGKLTAHTEAGDPRDTKTINSGITYKLFYDPERGQIFPKEVKKGKPKEVKEGTLPFTAKGY